jgi:release factor-specific protein-(glutamine-N5) methyltransferase
MSKTKQTKIGGQALFDGIMMRGPERAAMAVRKKDGTIHVEEWELPQKRWYQKVFFIRGVFNFVIQMRDGYKYMMKSAEISGAFDDDEELTGRFEKWLNDKFGDKLMSFVMVLGVILGVVLAVALFMFLPTWIAGAICSLLNIDVMREPLIAGIIRIIIFIAYLALTSAMKDIHKTFQYHGAEHMTIFAHESDAELTVENVKNYKRFHPRCGTSFIFLVLVISIIFHSFLSLYINREIIIEALGVGNFAASSILSGFRLLCLPVLIGISYEVLRLAGRYDRNIIMQLISAPGMGIQRLTTKDPDEGQLEVALAAFIPVIPVEQRTMHNAQRRTNNEEKWLQEYAEKSGEDIEVLRARRESGEPLQYILGEWEFYGYTFKVGRGVLIPRPETEFLVDLAKEHEPQTVYDLCAGSGCVGIALANETGCEVIAVEISDEAIEYLEQNKTDKIKVVKADVLSSGYVFEEADCILVNPPYLTAQEMRELQAEVTHEPEIALYGGEDGLDFYRKLFGLWGGRLKQGGLFAVEVGATQAGDVANIMRQHGFEPMIKKDYAGIERIVYATKG